MNFHFNYDSLKLYHSSLLFFSLQLKRVKNYIKTKTLQFNAAWLLSSVDPEEDKIANQIQEVPKLALKLLGILVDFHTLMDFNVYAFPLFLIQIKLLNFLQQLLLNFYVFIRVSKKILSLFPRICSFSFSLDTWYTRVLLDPRPRVYLIFMHQHKSFRFEFGVCFCLIHEKN